MSGGCIFPSSAKKKKKKLNEMKGTEIIQTGYVVSRAIYMCCPAFREYSDGGGNSQTYHLSQNPVACGHQPFFFGLCGTIIDERAYLPMF